MKPYKNWLEENKEKLLDDYEFDVNEALNVNGDIETIKSFKDWSKIMYEMAVEDEKYDKEKDNRNVYPNAPFMKKGTEFHKSYMKQIKELKGSKVK